MYACAKFHVCKHYFQSHKPLRPVMADQSGEFASFDMSGVDAALADILENTSQEPRSCNYRGMCSRKRCRGACPCTAIDEYCNNGRPVADGALV